jgi:hypothetical protein
MQRMSTSSNDEMWVDRHDGNDHKQRMSMRSHDEVWVFRHGEALHKLRLSTSSNERLYPYLLQGHSPPEAKILKFPSHHAMQKLSTSSREGVWDYHHAEADHMRRMSTGSQYDVWVDKEEEAGHKQRLFTDSHDDVWEEQYADSTSAQNDLQGTWDEHEASDSAGYSPIGPTEEKKAFPAAVDEEEQVDPDVRQFKVRQHCQEQLAEVKYQQATIEDQQTGSIVIPSAPDNNNKGYKSNKEITSLMVGKEAPPWYDIYTRAEVGRTVNVHLHPDKKLLQAQGKVRSRQPPQCEGGEELGCKEGNPHAEVKPLKRMDISAVHDVRNGLHYNQQDADIGKLGVLQHPDRSAEASSAKLFSSAEVYKSTTVKLSPQGKSVPEEKGGKIEMMKPKKQQVTHLIHDEHLRHVSRGEQVSRNSASLVVVPTLGHMNRSPAVLPEESSQQVGTGILCHPGILYHCPHIYQHKRSHQIQHGEDQYPEQEIEHVVGHHHDEHKVQHEVSIGHRLFGPQHMDLEVYQVHGQHNHQGQNIQEEDNHAPEPQDDHQVVAVSLHGAGGELSQSGTTQHQLQQGHHSQSCCVVHSLPGFCSSDVEVIGSNMGSAFMIRVEELGDNTGELVENIEGATPRAARKLYVDKVATDSIRTSWTVASTAGDSCKASAEFRDNGSVDLSSTHNKHDDKFLVVLAFPMASVETVIVLL